MVHKNYHPDSGFHINYHTKENKLIGEKNSTCIYFHNRKVITYLIEDRSLGFVNTF